MTDGPDLTNQQFAIVLLAIAVAFLIFVVAVEQSPSSACQNLHGEWVYTGSVDKYPGGPTVDTYECRLP